MFCFRVLGAGHAVASMLVAGGDLRVAQPRALGVGGTAQRGVDVDVPALHLVRQCLCSGGASKRGPTMTQQIQVPGACT